MSELSTVLLPAALVLAGLGVGLLLRHPLLACALLVAADSSNVTGVVSERFGVSLFPPLLALTAAAVLARWWRGRSRPVRRVSTASRPSRGPLLALLVVLGCSVVTLLSSRDAVTTLDLVVERGRDALYFVLVLGVLTRYRTGPRTVVAALVVVFGGLAVLSVVHQFLLGGVGELGGLSRVPLVQEDGAATPRHAGTSSDVNFWARLLLLVLPLAASVAAASGRRPQRVLWTAVAAAIAVGLYLTQSRGGFLALGVVVLVWLWFAGGRYRRCLLLVPVVLAVVMPLSGIGARLATLTELVSAPTRAAADPSLVTRLRLQEAAWRMFLDRPLTGQGLGTYGTLFPGFDRFSGVPEPVDITVAAHNFFLEQAADGGVPLLTAWLVLLALCLRSAARVAGRGETLADRRLGAGLVAAFAGWMAASVFLHLSDLRTVLVLVAVSAVLEGRLPPADPDASSGRLRGREALGQRVAGGALALSVLAAVGGAGLIVLGPSGGWVVRTVVPLTALPSGTVWVDAYRTDLVSRGVLVPTLAVVVQRSTRPPARLDVDVSSSSSGGALVIEVSGPDREAVRRFADVAVDGAAADVAATGVPYRTAPVRPPSAVPVDDRRRTGLVLALVGAAGVCVVLGSSSPVRRRSEVSP